MLFQGGRIFSTSSIMERLLVTISNIQRYKVLTEVLEKRLPARDASEILSLSYRHTLRFKEADGLLTNQWIESIPEK